MKIGSREPRTFDAEVYEFGNDSGTGLPFFHSTIIHNYVLLFSSYGKGYQ